MGDLIDDAEIESAAGSAERRVREQEPWLTRLPDDFSSVLDIGAGAGLHSKWLLDHGRKPVALDRNARAFVYHDDIEFVVADLDELDGSRTFDAVFCSHVLEHFPDPGDAIARMRRLIRPGGYLFVIVPPYLPLVVNYHWHTGWNCAQLAMLLAASGFDCSQATFMQVALNVCGWGRKSEFEPTRFNLRRSMPYLPAGLRGSYFERDGDEFLPGDLAIADPQEARRLPEVVHLAAARLDPNQAILLEYGAQVWRSAEQEFDAPGVDFTKTAMRLVVETRGKEPGLRIAVASGESGWGACAHYYLSAKDGVTMHTFTAGDLDIVAGAPDLRAIRRVSIGGFGQDCSLRVWWSYANALAPGI